MVDDCANHWDGSHLAILSKQKENEAIKKVWYTVSTLLLILPLFTSVLGTTTAFAEENGESAQLVIQKENDGFTRSAYSK